MPDRPTFVNRDVIAGCSTCFGATPHWTGPAAQGNAARHHDATGHRTWCEVAMTIHYGHLPEAAEQLEIEAAIAAVPA